MAKELNKQQRDYIASRLQGDEHMTAVRKAYPNLTKGSAYVIGCRLKKHPLVQEQLKIGDKELRGRIFDKTAKFIDILRELCPPRQVAEKLAELVFSGDDRVASEAIEKYLKLSSEYPPATLGVYRDFEKEREKILSPADLPRLLAEQQAELKRAEIMKVEEAVIIEKPAENKKVEETKI